jgi:hypothetical protein
MITATEAPYKEVRKYIKQNKGYRGLWLWCLTPHSTIFQWDLGGQFYWWRTKEDEEEWCVYHIHLSCYVCDHPDCCSSSFRVCSCWVEANMCMFCLLFVYLLCLWHLTPLSTLFKLYHCGQFYWWCIKPPTCHKSLTNFIIKCSIESTSSWAGFEITALVVIGTDCIGSILSGIRTHNLRVDRHWLHR